ncbi:serpin family protein [Thermoflexibacter ruber]|uniref:Serpin B n=1 Tax=Thermoflexibacter ruber TaxID=1003 RepID=A0A1I2JE64_9BACT|nr:serpin family protein [Thermoflexibacter ruber]SFF52270.1 serpin B [Thermoflexibacter ruber]
MKKHLKNNILIFLFLFIFACSSPTINDTSEDLPNIGDVPKSFTEATDDFAFNLLKTTNASEPAEDNIFISPLSVHIALGMLLNGADGTTAQEINKVLGLGGMDIEQANRFYASLLTNLPKADAKVNLNIANSIWYRNTFPVESSFISTLQNAFLAEATPLNFDDPTVKNVINNWVNAKTQNRIPKIIEQINPDDVMFLINAVYFKGDWKYQFSTEATQEWLFNLSNTSTKKVQMMNMQAELAYNQRSNYTAVVLPYSKGNFNLTLILPSADQSLTSFINSFTEAEWKNLQNSLTSTRKVNVGLPKFTLEYDIALNNVLQSMGIKEAFSNQANLTKISKQGRLYVNSVKHKTFLQIDEKGTEAAGVTSIGVGVTSVNPNTPPTIIFDRPFLMILSEKQSNTILFMGKITNP